MERELRKTTVTYWPFRSIAGKNKGLTKVGVHLLRISEELLWKSGKPQNDFY